MTRRATALLLILSATAAAAVALRRDPGYLRMPSPYGTAALAAPPASQPLTNSTMFNVILPPGEHAAVTVTGWFRLLYPGRGYMTTMINYTPEAIPESRPDLLGGAAGFPDGATLPETVTVAAFPFGTYADPTSSNTWPRGVYTVAGWSSNVLTVALGGNERNVGPGPFNVNMLPGPSSGCVIAGGGRAAVGVCLTPDGQFFSHVDGVTEDRLFTEESVVTNELAFCAWRLRLDDSTHVYRSDLILYGEAASTAITRTNGMPRSARALSSRGIYQIGFCGLLPDGTITAEWWDPRVVTRWLTEAELRRVREDGAAEISARQIPRWKQP